MTKGDEGRSFGLRSRMLHYRVPGVSIAVVAHYRVVCARGYGVLQSGTVKRVGPATLFQMASLSKPVTAATALTLVEQGVLHLDQPVNSELRSWTLPDSDQGKANSVSLRRLLSHSGGLSTGGFDGYLPGAPLPSLIDMLNGRAPANSPAVRIEIPPGSTWRYSGGGYLIVEQMIEDATRASFEAAASGAVLTPLHMTHSTFAQPLPGPLWPIAARGHGPDGRTLAGQWRVHPELAAAALWSTPADMAHLCADLMSGAANRPSILSPAVARWMTRAQPGLKADASAAGLGLALDGEGRSFRFRHGGSNLGYRSLLIGFPKTGDGAVIAVNGEAGTNLILEVLRAIAARQHWPVQFQNVLPSTKHDRPGAAQYAGTYRWGSADDEAVKVRERSGSLWVEAVNAVPERLIAIGPRRFAQSETGSTYSFKLRSGSVPASLEIREFFGRVRIAERDDTRLRTGESNP